MALIRRPSLDFRQGTNIHVKVEDEPALNATKITISADPMPGPPGVDGADGTDGPPGPTGPPGLAGASGGATDKSGWMPLTTTVGGVPDLVWDANDSLIPTYVPF